MASVQPHFENVETDFHSKRQITALQLGFQRPDKDVLEVFLESVNLEQFVEHGWSGIQMLWINEYWGCQKKFERNIVEIVKRYSPKKIMVDYTNAENVELEGYKKTKERQWNGYERQSAKNA